MRRRIGEALAEYEMTLQQYAAMSVLHSRGHLSNAELARRSFMTPQSASVLVLALEEKGWVERAPDPRHARILHIRLSVAGCDVLQRGDKMVSALQARMLAQLTLTQRRELDGALDACARALGGLYADD